MITKNIEISNGVCLKYIETCKFKTNYFSINFLSLLSNEKSHYNALIPLVLMRGSNKYKTQSEINKRLQYLYSGEVVARNDSFGEYQIIGFKANMLDNRFILTHRSCYINDDRKVSVDKTNKIILFDNSEKIDLLSDKYRKEIC